MSLVERIRGELRLSAARYEHTLRVADCALELAARHFPDLSPERVELAALLHDCTKEYTDEQHLEILRTRGLPIPLIQTLYHAATGAVLAAEIYGVDKDIQSAIQYHTTAKPDMTPLEAIIYLADFIEPGRDYEDCRKVREEYLREYDLKEAVLLSLDIQIDRLLRKNMPIEPLAVEARNWLLNNI